MPTSISISLHIGSEIISARTSWILFRTYSQKAEEVVEKEGEYEGRKWRVG
jgi:hypothetical protein